MTENTNRVDEAHRKELLRFLLVKTAAVRRGVKPGELLRVAAETIANAAKEAGATLVGDVLKLDDTNEADQTDGKIAAWVDTLKAAL